MGSWTVFCWTVKSQLAEHAVATTLLLFVFSVFSLVRDLILTASHLVIRSSPVIFITSSLLVSHYVFSSLSTSELNKAAMTQSDS